MTKDLSDAIEAAMREVGDFGTVELVIHNGRVAFVCPKRSIKVVDSRQQELPVT